LAHHDDVESHIKAVEEDMEYWRTKRLEPRVFRLLRKGHLSFFDIIETSQEARSDVKGLKADETNIEDRVAVLEIELGKFIRSIEVATSIIGSLVLVEESREDAGVYDQSLKFVHRRLSGPLEERASQLEKLLYENMVLVRSVLISLTRKGLVSSERLREMLESESPPRYENGAKIVAKAWLDPKFKSRLMSDAKATLRELGFALNRTPKLVVLEDTKSIHNVIVCTLCSCYPYELLGNPPWWYKHERYKDAIVKHPRTTLKEMFGVVVPEDVEIQVSDSTSDIRYMVLPERPEGTQGMSEDELSKLVSPESLIGAARLLKYDDL
jgi:nitrile hydratase subunit alpha